MLARTLLRALRAPLRPPRRAQATLVSSPPEALAAAAETGAARLTRDAGEAFTGAVLGATFLSLSSCLYLSTLAGTPQLRATNPGLQALLCGLVFPSGLAMIVFAGADLVTANFYYLAVHHRLQQAPGQGLGAPAAARVLGLSAAGNLAGSLAMAGAVSSVLIQPGSPAAQAAREVAERKTRQGAALNFGKAVGANFLVCTAIFMATASKTPGGKLAALWLPISLFVTLGLEHSVMNYFVVPLGMLSGAEVSVAEALAQNLVPVTLGNALGAFALARLQLPHAAARALAQRLASVRTAAGPGR